MATQQRVASVIEHYLFKPEDESLPDFTVLEFFGHEGISQLMHFEIRLLCTDKDIDFSAILNKRASLKIWCWQDSDYTRAYHGIISSFEQIGQVLMGQDNDKVYAIFRAELVPLVWRLNLRYECRIFQDKSVTDIIEEVLSDAGIQQSDYRMSLEGTYEPINKPPREFCVQYRETDFNFISRLMEEEGIFYFFDQGDNKETMVIADSSSFHEDTTPQSEVKFEESTGLQPLDEEFISSLTYRESVISTKFTLKDFNYDTSKTNLLSSSQGEDEFAVYDYPGGFGFLNQGKTTAGIRKEENDIGKKRISGVSNVRSFCSGRKYELTSHPRSELEDNYVLTSVIHHGVQGGPLATDAETSYDNSFECIPFSVPFRPPVVTPRARVYGTQTATVVGPSGEELYMDEKGRAKVQFHWDLDGSNNESSSCWVRVSHGYAGQNHGIQFHPLVGDEVIVDFLEGDPDKPIIVGRVYNGQNLPHLKPEDRVQNLILTPYQHRLIFDDKATSITLNTGGNETFTLTDGDDKKSEYGNNAMLSTADGHAMRLAKGTEDNSIKLSTEGGHVIVMNDEDRGIGLKSIDEHRLIIHDDDAYILLMTASEHYVRIDDPDGVITIHATTVNIEADDIKATAAQSIKLDAGGDIEIKAGGSIDVEAGGDINVTAGGKLSMESGMNLEAKAGVDMKLDANMNMNMKASMKLEAEGSLSATLKGLNVTTEATAMNEVKGPVMVKIQGGFVTIN